ncbi:hypothetical protein [Pseudoalteromonas lipolytica]
MKLALFSDIHNEFEVWTPPKIDADVVILAGDIHSKHHGIQWAKDFFELPVVYIPGIMNIMVQISNRLIEN